MRATSSPHQTALLNIFRDAPSSAVSFSEYELAVAWNRRGLRLGDLEAVLWDLTDRELLVTYMTGSVQRISLTNAGRKAIDSQPQNAMRYLRDWWELQVRSGGSQD